MGVEKLLRRKLHGDWVRVSKKTGLSTVLCIYAINNIGSKNYIAVVRALREVIEEREVAIREALGEEI